MTNQDPPSSQPSNQSPLHQMLQCLRSHIVDFLEYQLKNDTITEKRASDLAQAVLDRLTDDLTHDQIHQVISGLEKDFPEELKNLEASVAACETDQARQAVDNEVLKNVTAGNIDAALATLNKFKIK